MSNLGDLNSILFNQLQNLCNSENEKLDQEIKKSEAISKVSEQLLRSGELQFKVLKCRMESKSSEVIPELLEVKK